MFSSQLMSSNKFCLNCGCTSFVSDRSLGGKIVCFKCGSSRFREKSLFNFSVNIPLVFTLFDFNFNIE